MKNIFLSLIVFSSTLFAADISKVVGISEGWEGATEENCGGFYWQVAKEVFAQSDIELECSLAPYERSVRSVKVGKADFWVASYMSEEEFAVYPKHHFDADTVVALYDKTKVSIQSVQDLQNKKVVWIRGYSYNEYTDVKMNFTELDNRDSAIKMIQFGRVDAYLDAKAEMELALEKMQDSDENLVMKNLMYLPLYMAFNNTDRGRSLAEIWDRNIEKLDASGRLREMYKKAGYTEIYPFDGR